MIQFNSEHRLGDDMKIGILALGRPTFDVDYANAKLIQMLGLLDQSGHTIVGPRELLFDEKSTKQAADIASHVHRCSDGGLCSPNV